MDTLGVLSLAHFPVDHPRRLVVVKSCIDLAAN